MPPTRTDPADHLPPLAPGQVVRHEGLALLEVEEAADLAALLADPKLADLIVARIGDREAVVLPGVVARLLLTLAKAGHTPNLVDEP